MMMQNSRIIKDRKKFKKVHFEKEYINDLILDLQSNSSQKQIHPIFKDNISRRNFRTYKSKNYEKNKSHTMSISSEITRHSINSKEQTNTFKQKNQFLEESFRRSNYLYLEDEIDHKTYKFFKYLERETPLKNTDDIIHKSDESLSLKEMECDNDVMTDDEQIKSGNDQLMEWLKNTFDEIEKNPQYLNDKLSKKLKFSNRRCKSGFE